VFINFRVEKGKMFVRQEKLARQELKLQVVKLFLAD
jgi:hypothetical protein